MSSFLNEYQFTPKSGDEPFLSEQKELSFDLREFWSWNQSDLLNNRLRGVLAEFIVYKALDKKDGSRIEWDSIDIETEKGIKIEVKSSAYLQTWSQKKLSPISFDIAQKKGWDFKTNVISDKKLRSSDLYIFCVLNHKEQDTVNPLDLDQWIFFLLKTEILDNSLENQKSVSLSKLKSLKAKEMNFEGLKIALQKYK